MILAVVPAAGKSRRMGRSKLTLPLGGRNVLEWALAGLRQGGVEQVLVVVGPGEAQLVPSAEAAGARILLLTEETDDMRTTVEHGLRWLEERFRPGNDAAWFLTPADHPTLDSAVVRTLLQARWNIPIAVCSSPPGPANGDTRFSSAGSTWPACAYCPPDSASTPIYASKQPRRCWFPWPRPRSCATWTRRKTMKNCSGTFPSGPRHQGINRIPYDLRFLSHGVFIGVPLLSPRAALLPGDVAWYPSAR